MKRDGLPIWLCMLVLGLALVWRMLGAPLSAEQLRQSQTPLWQARVLWPSRVQRVLRLWLPSQSAPAPATLVEESQSPEQRALQADVSTIRVYLAEEKRLEEMTLSGYVCGVVAAEMPASYHLEALKAQAVAARTRAVFQMQNGGCSLHSGADICTDSAHCQGYASLQDCHVRWQDAYEAYRDRVLQAESETSGLLLTYQGKPITVMYHAISGGRTESAAAVFSQAEPYLVSVSSSGEEQARGFQQETKLSFGEMADKLTAAGWTVTADEIRRTLTISAYTEAGRVADVQVGEQHISGPDFRRALSLRSTWFAIEMDEEGVTFSQRGYGHGVGMSQAGANGMAANGAAYQEILAHYYPGTALEKYSSE